MKNGITRRRATTARKLLAIVRARALLVECGVEYLPINPFQIAATFGWGPRTYAWASWRSGLPIDSLAYGEDGCALKRNGRYLILYDDRILSSQRQRFTVAHEIGHIVMGHLECQTPSDEEEILALEEEADFFAAETLMPMPLLVNLRLADWRSIARLCNVSCAAAKKRAVEVRAGLEARQAITLLEGTLLGQFESFLARVRPVIAASA